MLAALEGVLTRQPFLLGARFTVADASVYGQFGMNLKDPHRRRGDAAGASPPRIAGCAGCATARIAASTGPWR
jgi:glutathione S-transferase